MASFYNVKGRVVASTPTQSNNNFTDESKMGQSFIINGDGRFFSSAGLATITLYIITALLYHFLDRLTLIDSLYAAVGIVTTVGVLIPPTSRYMYVCICILSWLSMGVGSIAISEIADAHTKRIQETVQNFFHKQQFLSNKANSYSIEEARLLICIAFPILTLGACFFSYSEKWSFFTSLYFVCTAACGLGYTEGIDLTNTRSKIGFIIFITLSMGVTISLLGLFGMYIRDFFGKVLIRNSIRVTKSRFTQQLQQQQHQQHQKDSVTVQGFVRVDQ